MSSDQTRLTLLRAAERLFAANGVDAVSLRQVAHAAGQRNHSAVAYHFANKHELVNALLARHSDPMSIAWLVALDHLAAEGRDTLPELVALLVRPLVAKLDDPDGGADYLSVVAQLVTSRTHPLLELPAVSAPGILALSAGLMRHAAPIPPQLLQLRMMRMAAVLYCSIADYHRLVGLGLPIERAAFVDDLIASIVGLLRGAPPDPADAVDLQSFDVRRTG